MARGHFAKSEKQAASVMKEMQGKGAVLESVGTVRNYEQALKTCCDYLKENKLGGLRDLTPEKAETYLNIRSLEVSQKTLNMDRQALQAMMQNVTNTLSQNQKLSIIKSELDTIVKSRAYTQEQVQAITQRQTASHALSTNICHTVGLRAHELYTLRLSGEVAPSPRKIHPAKFDRLSNTVTYTVTGKGGLIREVQLPRNLSVQLEQRRLEHPHQVTDRGVNYTTYYDLPAGIKFSSAFSKASQRALSYSNGAHGLRHSYAQNRFEQLSNYHAKIDVMKIVSQELGHFRPEITEVYLR